MIANVNTIDETRRTRLEMLIKQHGGLLANLNEALGFERTHSQLARIRNRNARKDRPGKFFEMGDDQARTIEEKLGLPIGWMDTPPSYTELSGGQEFLLQTFKVMEQFPPLLQSVAANIINSLEKINSFSAPALDDSSTFAALQRFIDAKLDAELKVTMRLIQQRNALNAPHK